MSAKKNYLSVEAPDTSATVDLLSVNVSVNIEIDKSDNTVRIVAKAQANETDSDWIERTISIPIIKND